MYLKKYNISSNYFNSDYFTILKKILFTFLVVIHIIKMKNLKKPSFFKTICFETNILILVNMYFL